jgi:hypothetical protein
MAQTCPRALHGGLRSCLALRHGSCRRTFRQLWPRLTLPAYQVCCARLCVWSFTDASARFILQAHLEERFVETKNRVHWLLKLDHRPFTTNTHYLADYKEKFMAYFKSSRQSDLYGNAPALAQRLAPDSQPYQDVSEILSRLSRLQFPNIAVKDLVKLLPDDHMLHALEIMAEVRAYFQGMKLV